MEASDYGEGAKALARAGDVAAAEGLLRRGLEAYPSSTGIKAALAVLLLQRGDYAEGWKFYESRRALPQARPDPKFSFPEWQGEPVKSLVVLPEQGFGDQIQFARYVPSLVARDIAVTLITPPPLVRLFGRLGADVLEVRSSIQTPKCDAWCYIGSLPRLVGGFPNAPYLPGASGGQGIGVMLAGSGRNGYVMPSRLRSSLAVSGVSLDPADTGARDFEDTAEIIRKLALVVSVDTAVAHLAGAMGKPVYVVLSANPDWRWGREGVRSNWYPSARLFRPA